MATAATYTKTGTKAKTATKLDKAVFEAVPKDYTLLKQAYLAYLTNSRQNAAKVKTRADVRGGGRKPWRQKGTGRARAGSIRSPIWRGGGITFGPTGAENYTKQLPRRAKLLALRQALSLKAKEKAVLVVETFEPKEGRVKEALDLLKKLKTERNVLLIVEQKNELIDRATRNLPNVSVISANYLNVFSVLNADHLVFTKPALTVLGKQLKDKQEAKDV